MRMFLNTLQYLYILTFKRKGKLTFKNWKSVYYAACLIAAALSKTSTGLCALLLGRVVTDYKELLGDSVIHKAITGLNDPKLFPDNLKYVYYLKCLDFKVSLNMSFLSVLFIDGTLSQEDYVKHLPSAHFKDKVLTGQGKFEKTETFDNVYIIATLISICNDVLLGKTTREYAFSKITELCYEKE